ncbi:MAG: TonB-dependent receptor [bacterium]
MGIFVSVPRDRLRDTQATARAVFRVCVLLCVLATGARAQFPPELRGRVTDGATGAPIAGAEISVTGFALHVVTSGDGTFVVRGLTPGDATVGARRLGYTGRPVDVTLANGRVTVATISLRAVPQELARVATRADRDGSVAANASRVSREAIIASGAPSVAEVLEREPGVVVTRRGGPGSPATISLRGSESNQVLVLVDGVPINDALSGVADLSSISTSAVDCVTILRGAQSARYGPQALAGVVLVETRKPDQGSAELTQSVGSWGEQRSALSLGDAGVAGGLRLSAHADADQRRVGSQFVYDVPITRGGGIAFRDNDDSRLRQAVAQVGLSSTDADLTLRTDWLDVDRGMPGSIVQPSASGRQLQDREGAALSARFTRSEWRIAADVQAQRQTAQYNDPSPPFGAAFETRVRATTILGGLSVERSVGAWNTSGGIERRQISATGNALRADADPTQSLVSAWTDETWTHSSESGFQFELTAAGRVDAHSLLPAAVFSPRVQATVGRGPASLFASWGKAFAPPSLADLFFQEGVQTQSNPSLAPERVNNDVTAGVRVSRQAFGPAALSGDISAFRADVQGMILWFPDFRFVWRPDNFNVTRRGIEAQVTAGLLDDALQLRTNATYARVEYAGPVLGGQVIYRPRVSGSSTMTARLPGLVTLDATWRETGERTTNIGSVLNTIPAFGMLDGAVSRRFTTRGAVIDVRIGVANALDTHAVMLPDYPFPGRGWTVSLHVLSRDG